MYSNDLSAQPQALDPPRPSELHRVVVEFPIGVEVAATPALPPIDAVADPARGVEFVLRIFGPTTVVAHHPDMGPRGGIWLDESAKDEVIRWIEARNHAGCNIYLHPNQPRHGLNKKANKGDIEFTRMVWADLECYKNGQTMASAWALNTALPLKPTVVIASGGGLHPYFHFHEGELATPERAARAQALGQRIIDRTGGGDPVANIDRIMRFPFTTNYPNAKKREVGRTACPSGVVIGEEGPRYTLEELEAAFPPTNVVHFPGGPDRPKTSVPVNTPIAGTPPAIMAKRAGAVAAQQAAAAPSLNAAAQTHMQWFSKLSPENQNAALRAIAALPEIIAIADRDKLAGYLNILFAFADAAHRGATEAYEIARQWAQTSPARYNDADFDRDWRSFKPGKPGGITVATLLDAAKNVGFDTQPWRDLATGVGTMVVDQSGSQDGAVPMTAIPTRLMPEAAVDVMNRTFVFAHNWGGETLIAHRQANGRVEAIDDRQLKRSLENRRVVIQNKDKTELAPLATFWLTHQQRHEVDRVIFDPEGSRANPGEKTFNLWNGLARQPQRGRWRLMANHMFVVLCRSNRACWRYLLRWLAHAVQYPGTAPGSVIVLRSDAEGAGKSLLLNWMTWIFGEHGIFLNDPDDFIGEFNDHLENKCFISLNEPAFPGDHRAAGKLKSMITEPEWVINGKYRKRRRVPNIAHTMMTTNREWAIPAGDKARRFLMLDVDDARVGDDNYFTSLRHEADNGGIEAMLHALLHIDLTNFNPWSVPKTAALREQQLRSASTMVRWAADAARAGELIPSDPRPWLAPALPNGGFNQQVHGPTLYRAYETWCRAMRERPEAHVVFGRWLSGCGVPGRRSNGASRFDVPDARTFIAAVLTKAGIV